MKSSEFEFRVLDALDGTLSGEEFMALQTELLEDTEAREVFKRFARLHSDLEMNYSPMAKTESPGVVPVDRIIARQRKRIMKGSLGAAAALVVISAVWMWFSLSPEPKPLDVTFHTTPDALFEIEHSGGDKIPVGNVLTVGSSIKLISGTLEGRFANGVRVVADAPCDFRVLSENRIGLGDGRVWLQVPSNAVGFEVETSDLLLVDLGTEFGVFASENEEHEVHVSKGAVEISSRLGTEKAEVLQAGTARKLTKDGRFQVISSDISRFQTQLPETISIPIVNHSFEDDVIKRDGRSSTVDVKKDDFDPDLLPVGWSDFDDGRNESISGNARGIVSHASDSFFNLTLTNTLDNDANDQSFFSSHRDIYQVLGAVIQANTSYTLKIDIGDRWLLGEAAGQPGSPVIRLGSGIEPGAHLLEPVAKKFPGQIDGDWVTWVLYFRTGPAPAYLGEPLRIELTNGTNVGWFDNIRLSATMRVE